MSPKLSRREFLKLSSLAVGAAAFTTLSPTDLRLAQPQTSLGRVLVKPPNRAQIFDGPRRLAQRIGFKEPNDVVEIYRAVVGEGFYAHNHVWFEIPEGFIYSTIVQPVKNLTQKPLTTLPPGGFFAEVSVPLTPARSAPDPNSEPVYFGKDDNYAGDSNLYYSAVFKIDQITTDAQGGVWYHIAPDQKQNYWAQGQHLRVIQPDEILPISPNVSDKIIVANVKTNWLSAYEGQTEVFRTRIASGASFFAPDGSERAGIKAGGTYKIYSKRISRQMSGGIWPNGYDLPGVGWVSYWHQGAAIHSTYWHNNFGVPRSHGCLNCSPEAAKWLFRWATPLVNYIPGQLEVYDYSGSIVDIQGEPPPLADDAG